MTDFLAYSSPSGKKVLAKGIWKETTFSLLKENHFFVTDFLKEKTFYFEKEDKLNDISEIDNFEIPSTKESLFTISMEEYLQQLNNFIEGFSKNEIKKAVFSRISEIENDIALSTLFSRLEEKYGNKALIYIVSSDNFGTWIGATPEILLEGNTTEIRSMSLAGTKAKEGIQWTSKEEEEQQIVTDFIADKITKYEPTHFSQSEPYTFYSGAVYHLRSDFSFQLPKQNWLPLIKELHPTPAVCGIPTKKAVKHILSFEKHERKFYTGLIGFITANELQVYVNLRCMEKTANGFALYLGGGITDASDPQDEWNETENKAKTLLSIFD